MQQVVYPASRLRGCVYDALLYSSRLSESHGNSFGFLAGARIEDVLCLQARTRLIFGPHIFVSCQSCGPSACGGRCKSPVADNAKGKLPWRLLIVVLSRRETLLHVAHPPHSHLRVVVKMSARLLGELLLWREPSTLCRRRIPARFRACLLMARC